jgi:hypothetical protein
MENQLSTKKFALTYGLILGLIAVLLAVLGYVMGAVEKAESWPSWIFYLIFAIFIFYAVFTYRKQNGGYMTLGQALKAGVSVAVISGVIYALYNYVFFTFIEPDIIERIMATAEEKMMIDNPQLTDDQVEMALSWAEKFANPIFGGAVLIVMSAFFGFIWSLFAGLIWKREEPVN